MMPSVLRAAAIALCFGFLTSCTEAAKEVGPPAVTSASEPTTPPHEHAPTGHRITITVQPGQSLGRIAEAYKVPKKVIIAANNLAPPYELKAGARLIIPDATAEVASSNPKKVVPAVISEDRKRSQKSGELEEIPLDGPSPPRVIPLD
jgi:LysM repeat protein